MAIVALSGTAIGCCDGSGGSRGYSRKVSEKGAFTMFELLWIDTQ